MPSFAKLRRLGRRRTGEPSQNQDSNVSGLAVEKNSPGVLKPIKLFRRNKRRPLHFTFDLGTPATRIGVRPVSYSAETWILSNSALFCQTNVCNHGICKRALVIGRVLDADSRRFSWSAAVLDLHGSRPAASQCVHPCHRPPLRRPWVPRHGPAGRSHGREHDNEAGSRFDTGCISARLGLPGVHELPAGRSGLSGGAGG